MFYSNTEQCTYGGLTEQLIHNAASFRSIYSRGRPELSLWLRLFQMLQNLCKNIHQSSISLHGSCLMLNGASETSKLLPTESKVRSRYCQARQTSKVLYNFTLTLFGDVVSIVQSAQTTRRSLTNVSSMGLKLAISQRKRHKTNENNCCHLVKICRLILVSPVKSVPQIVAWLHHPHFAPINRSVFGLRRRPYGLPTSLLARRIFQHPRRCKRKNLLHCNFVILVPRSTRKACVQRIRL